MKWRIPFLILIIAVVVIGIYGFINSDFNSTKHFDNGVVAFDYPSNMEVEDHGIGGITLLDGSTTMLNMAIINNTAPEANYTIVNDNNLKYFNHPGLIVIKKTINGRTAYDFSQRSGDSTYYYTFIDIGTGQIQIFPASDPQLKDQKDTRYYKTYQMVVNSFHVK